MFCVAQCFTYVVLFLTNYSLISYLSYTYSRRLPSPSNHHETTHHTLIHNRGLGQDTTHPLRATTTTWKTRVLSIIAQEQTTTTRDWRLSHNVKESNASSHNNDGFESGDNHYE